MNLRLPLILPILFVLASCSNTPSRDGYVIEQKNIGRGESAENIAAGNALLGKRRVSALRKNIVALREEEQDLKKEIVAKSAEVQGVYRSTPESQMSNAKQLTIANKNTQVKIATLNAETFKKEASLKSSKDTSLAKLEGMLEKEVAELKAKIKLKKAAVLSDFHKDMASIHSDNELSKAKVTAPIFTAGGIVLSDGEINLDNKNYNKSKNTLNKDYSIKNKTKNIKDVYLSDSNGLIDSGSMEPSVSRVVYDVIYVYDDKRSWMKFRKILEGYSIKDIMSIEHKKTGEFRIYAGRYSDIATAIKRKLYLNRKTFTSHAKVKSTRLYNNT